MLFWVDWKGYDSDIVKNIGERTGEDLLAEDVTSDGSYKIKIVFRGKEEVIDYPENLEYMDLRT